MNKSHNHHTNVNSNKIHVHHEKKHSSHEHHDHSGHEEIFKKKFWVSSLISIPVLLFSPTIQSFIGFQMPEFTGSRWITPVLSIVVFFYGGFPFLEMALPEIRNKKPGMMTLISLAIGVAFIYSIAAIIFPIGTTFFWELVTLIDIMLLGHWIEMRSVRKASGALKELAKLMPDHAEKIDIQGNIEMITTDLLRNGDIVLVRPGASVPADGIIIDGDSFLNEAMITGESKPVQKTINDQVIAGTINGDGSLRIKVSATGNETALAGIMKLVEQAQLSKSDTQILADKAAGWLFYVALGTALITAVAWTIAVGFDVEVIARVATVLVIACPHALGLAIPLVVAITTDLGAKNGILIRDRLALEKAREIDTIIFDKTGTLTKGEFGVVEIISANNKTNNEILSLAAAIEGDSEHTIAKGIRNEAKRLDLSVPNVSGFEAIKGKGAKAIIDNEFYYIGGPRLLEQFDISLEDKFLEFDLRASQNGQSVVHIIHEKKVIGSISLSDVVREESKLAIKRLLDMKINVVMLTGDSEPVAKSVANELNINKFTAEVLPEDKDKVVMMLQSEGKLVAMVGDGVNDAPALTRADIGIAVGSGTDVAVESAGIILVKSNPLDVVKIFSLSRASYRKMIQNLIWATGYNVIALPLAAGILAPVGVILSPAVGAVLMSLSTIIVAINAQLLRRNKLISLERN